MRLLNIRDREAEQGFKTLAKEVEAVTVRLQFFLDVRNFVKMTKDELNKELDDSLEEADRLCMTGELVDKVRTIQTNRDKKR